ncbi:formimidoylglutamase [Rothia terrae]|uniref:formimidoylglutamase n=1 Tax=Rothia terrae TaxID=396015 RepID=UPI0028810A81|nr:formimidoylglutamase [Rothia terrae]MDT0190316.1 formimidoylglutamase [Rothia terrae]
MSTSISVDQPAAAWSGRVDGDGAEHARIHTNVKPLAETSLGECDAVFIGFSSDEGVRRNSGRDGAATGPDALRTALGSLALAKAPKSTRVTDLALADAGTIVVDTDLEDGHRKLAEAVATAIDAGTLPVVLGGGHEVAFGTYSGVAGSRLRAHNGKPRTVGILNLDAHFDLRQADRPTSGTPFKQALDAERAHATNAKYAVIGISEASNTQVLFDTAQEYGVKYLLDEECTVSNKEHIETFVRWFIESVDIVYLTLDLDVLPAANAPGVSAPAAYGVQLEIINSIIKQVTRSGKLIAFDIAELNPSFDIDGRTAKTAARLAHTALTHHQPFSA